jgi:hypothetical protein
MGSGFWVSALLRVPREPGMCLANPLPDAPLGFALLGYACENLVSDFAETPLTRLATHPPKGTRRPRLRVSLDLHLVSSVASMPKHRCQDETTLLGFCAGFAPAY